MKSYIKSGLPVIAAAAIGICITVYGVCAAGGREQKSDDFVVGADIYSHEIVMESYTVKPAEIPSTLRIDVSYVRGTERRKNLPVVYFTDGHWRRTDHKYMHYLSSRGLIPPVLVVGIGYPEGYDIQRIRYTDLETNPSRFLAAIRNSVIHSVEKKFSCDPARRVLVGASCGGHFSLYAAYEIMKTNRPLFCGFVGSSAYLPGLDIDYVTGGMKEYRGDSRLFLYLSYGGREEPSLPGAEENIIRPNRELFGVLDSLALKNLRFAHRYNPDTDHYTNSRITYVEGVRLAFNPEDTSPHGFRDLSYGTFRYGFDSRTEMYDWEYSGALRNSSYAASDGVSGAKGAVILNVDFSRDRKGSFATTFDHFENLKGKKITYRIFVPENLAGKKYDAVVTLASTYGWRNDHGEAVLLDKAGWMTVSHTFDTVESGDASLARGFGLVIRKGQSSPAVKGSLVVDEVVW